MNDVNLDLPTEPGIYKIFRRDQVTNERIYVGTAEVCFESVSSSKKKSIKKHSSAKIIDLAVRRKNQATHSD